MLTLMHYQPHYSPHDEPYPVRARFDDWITVAFFWPHRDALDARDAPFDAGVRSVHVSGLPMIGAAAGFPTRADPLPNVEG